MKHLLIYKFVTIYLYIIFIILIFNDILNIYFKNDVLFKYIFFSLCSKRCANKTSLCLIGFLLYSLDFTIFGQNDGLQEKKNCLRHFGADTLILR